MDINSQQTSKSIRKKGIVIIIGFMTFLMLIVFLCIVSCPSECAKDSVLTVGKIVNISKGNVDLITYINGEKYLISEPDYFKDDMIGGFYLLCINKRNKYCINFVKRKKRYVELKGQYLNNFLLEHDLKGKSFDKNGEYKTTILGQAIGCWLLNVLNISDSDSSCGCDENNSSPVGSDM